MRYIVLVLLNIPIILFALLNFITKYKLKRISKDRFRTQMTFWTILLIVLITSFPIYNLATGRELLDSDELSLFDIFQTTAIILLFYIVNNLRQKNEQASRTLRDFHQEVSIQLSTAHHKKR